MSTSYLAHNPTTRAKPPFAEDQCKFPRYKERFRAGLEITHSALQNQANAAQTVLWSSSPLKGQVVASCPAQWTQTHVWLCSFLSGGRSTRATTLPTGNLSLKASGSACVGFPKRQKLAGPSCLSLVCQPPPQPPLRCLEQSAHSSDITRLQRAPRRWGRLSDEELAPQILVHMYV